MYPIHPPLALYREFIGFVQLKSFTKDFRIEIQGVGGVEIEGEGIKGAL
ncbi:hypothetical protein [Natronincola peptidivorans]|nr:hypothetical protein [Natronincola peptidivorans]